MNDTRRIGHIPVEITRWRLTLYVLKQYNVTVPCHRNTANAAFVIGNNRPTPDPHQT